MNDISLNYFGGSGGFLLLHLLLLSDQYHCSFYNNVSFDRAFKQQWQVDSGVHWKDQETWPDPVATQSSDTTLPRIYFNCNPDTIENIVDTDRKICLWTDLPSQIELCIYKQAYWFYLDTKKRRIYPEQWNDNLIPQLRNLCLSGDMNFWRDILVTNLATDFHNTPVLKKSLPYLQNSTVNIKLQDTVNSNGEILVENGLMSKITSNQLDLIQRWKRLHPAELLEKIGVR